MELNKIYSGFRLDRIERIDEINGTAYEMEHEKLHNSFLLKY